MLLLKSILIAAALSQTSPVAEDNGRLGGIVVRATDGQPMGGAEVVLSVRQGNEFIVVATTLADTEGNFRFDELPIAPDLIYKPGANWQGIHYPGPTTRLTTSRSAVQVKLTVNEAVSEPNPLVALRHEITLRPKPGILEVSETIVIDNPTMECYVGKPAKEGAKPETFCLHIPATFDQVTFDKEFFGRRFFLVDERLVTGIPWTPGQKELGFTYVVRNDQTRLTWTRPLDLACSDVTVRIITNTPEDVSSSLETAATVEPGAVVYRHSGSEFPAGHEIRIDIGHLPFSPLAYGKWVAAAFLVAILLTSASSRRRRHRPA